MGNVLNLLPNAVGQGQQSVVHAVVSLRKPQPASFSDPLYVIIPDWRPDYAIKLVDWPAVHGATLPVPGDEAVLIRDDFNTFWCVWWGSTTTGTAVALPLYGTGPPASGTYSQGDFVFNTQPAEAGSPGAKYVTLGWTCVSGGTPGTWLPARTLTGN